MKVSPQGRQTLAALAVVCAALAVCTVALSFRHTTPGKTVLANQDANNFQGEWSNWLNKVTTQVDAALHVSQGIPEQKKAQLNGILRHDLVSVQQPSQLQLKVVEPFSRGAKSSNLPASCDRMWT
jgi:hypothetical protein